MGQTVHKKIMGDVTPRFFFGIWGLQCRIRGRSWLWMS